MVNKLPSKTKDILMRILFLPVLAGALLIGGETVVLSQVVVRVAGPEVVLPRVVFPQVVVPQVVVPFPVYGDYDERRRDVYAYGHRGHESRDRAHHDDHGGRGERH
jgi:hypothetical protein